MSAPQIGEGKVEIEVDGKIGYLVPSLGACTEISNMAGGLLGAIERCQRMHFETICAIIGAGLEIDGRALNPRHRADMLPEAVYEGGVMLMAAKCVEFVHIIARGGRAIEDDEDESGEDSDAAPLE